MVLLLGDARRLAAAPAQVIELGAADLAAAHDLDRIDHRRVEREHPLHPLAIGDFPHREILVEAGAGAADADPLIGLNAGTLAFHHLDVHEHRIARRKIGNFLAGGKLCDLLFFELLDQIHGNSPSGSAGPGGARSYWLFGSGVLLRYPGGFVTPPSQAFRRSRAPEGPLTAPIAAPRASVRPICDISPTNPGGAH